MSDPAKLAAMEALRSAISTLLQIGYGELPEESRAVFSRALEAGHLELAARMTPTRLDVRLLVVVGAVRHELLAADADFKAQGPSVN